jgi:hypothetical protein
MIIRHKIWGEVEVEVGDSAFNDDGRYWWRNGAIYYESAGWREKVEVWEEVPEFFDDLDLDQVLTLNLAGGRFRVVERYDLPENWYEGWLNQVIGHNGHFLPVDARILRNTVRAYLNPYKRLCLIVERKARREVYNGREGGLGVAAQDA